MADPHIGGISRSRLSNDEFVAIIAGRGRVLDLPEKRRKWFIPVDSGVDLAPGDTAGEMLRIPQTDASKLLKGIARFVVDVAPNTNLDVVWELGRYELLVEAGSIAIELTPGMVTMSVAVSCDEMRQRRRIAVPFAVGRPESPRGLLMSTFDRVDAPAIIADAWSDAIIAFCWESLLELVRRISGEAGRDAQNRPLIPGVVAADERLLYVLPMARHDLSGLSR